jgi:hypothetical protein
VCTCCVWGPEHQRKVSGGDLLLRFGGEGKELFCFGFVLCLLFPDLKNMPFRDPSLPQKKEENE